MPCRPRERRPGSVRRLRRVRELFCRGCVPATFRWCTMQPTRAQLPVSAWPASARSPDVPLRRAFPIANEEPPMSADIQLISDGDGLAVIGEPSAVERFLAGEGLPSRDLGLKRLHSVLKTGSAGAQAGAGGGAPPGRPGELDQQDPREMSETP